MEESQPFSDSTSDPEATLEEAEVEFDIGGRIHITQYAQPFNVMEAPQSPKRMAQKLKAQGWSGRFGRSETHVDDLLWAASSDDEVENGHFRGDIRTPAHEEQHYWLTGRKGDRGFNAYWATRHGKTSFKNSKTNDGKYIYKMGELEEWLGLSAPKEETDESS